MLARHCFRWEMTPDQLRTYAKLSFNLIKCSFENPNFDSFFFIIALGRLTVVFLSFLCTIFYQVMHIFLFG